MSWRVSCALFLYAMACGCVGSHEVVAKASSPFISRVKRHVAPHWRPDLLRAEGVTVLQLQIRNDGSLANVVVEKSSGLASLDEEALGAVLVSSPFLDAMPAPPALMDRSGTIAFSVAFDYRGTDAGSQGRSSRIERRRHRQAAAEHSALQRVELAQGGGAEDRAERRPHEPIERRARRVVRA